MERSGKIKSMLHSEWFLNYPLYGSVHGWKLESAWSVKVKAEWFGDM